MFKRKKKIDEYMRISNGVKVPGEKEKIVNLNERRKKGMKKKTILSAAMVAVVSGVVLFSNIGAGLSNSGDKEIIVYASEKGSKQKVELKKGVKTVVDGGFVVYEDNGKGGMLKSEGIILDIESENLETVKLKANKGGFTEYTKGLPKDDDAVLFESKTGDNGEDTKKGEKIIEKVTPEYKEGKNELVLENVEGKATIEYTYSKDLAEELDKSKNKEELLKGIEIELECTYKGGKTIKNIIKLSMENNKIVAELK